MLTTNPTLAAVALGLLSALPTVNAGLYTKNSPVLQVDAKDFERLVVKSNYTTAVEFYAPWCGHCQALKPAYEKVAKNLEGLAHVAAVNCDADENKPLCGQMGIQGFPTVKIVRPGKKSGKPAIEDYNGPRTAKDIVNAVVDKINNHVKRVTDKDIDDFLSTNNETAKAILFSEKGTTSALLRSIAIDFLDVIQVAQVRSKETKANEIFGINSYPSLVLLPGGDKPGLRYDGQMKKEAMVEFLSQAGRPNPAFAPEAPKAKKEKKEKKDKKASEDKPTTTESAQTTTTKPVEVAPPIPAITDSAKLTQECLSPKSGTCILAFVPRTHGETAETALHSLSEIHFLYSRRKSHLFPMFEVNTEDVAPAALLKMLELSEEVELIAINGKRGWWRHYEDKDFSLDAVEAWIDEIRMSEGVKRKLPEGVIIETVGEKPATETVEVKVEEDVKIEVEPDAESSTSWQGAEPTPEATEAEEEEASESPADKHDEL